MPFILRRRRTQRPSINLFSPEVLDEETLVYFCSGTVFGRLLGQQRHHRGRPQRIHARATSRTSGIRRRDGRTASIRVGEQTVCTSQVLRLDSISSRSFLGNVVPSCLFHSDFFKRKNDEQIIETRLYPGRTPGGDRHYRGTGRALVTCGPGRARSRSPHELQQ